ncbi:MAG: hypothetical protein FWB71_06715 [Defluviitaleaceae bacterium]|nr:hypothetical protein [Defluviitaleaceae bacterium]
MIDSEIITLEMDIDPHNQWFVYIWTTIGNKKSRVGFKVDTGCNSLVLSHSTLKSMGFSTKESDLSKLPVVSGRLASGDNHTFRKLGAVSLFHDKGQALQICNAAAICHSTCETHDLLGTEVLSQFGIVSFDLDNKLMQLNQGVGVRR